MVLRWLIQKEVVAIPKLANVKRINENFNVFDFELSAGNMETIKSLDQGGGLIYSIWKTFENLATTITNPTTFYRITIKNFVRRFIPYFVVMARPIHHMVK